MRWLMLGIVLALPATVLGQNRPERAEIIFRNGNIYTVDERQPHAEALAVRNGRILFVGSNAQVKAYLGGNTRLVDLHGATVVPGLTDSHYHLSGVGEREISFNLEGTASLADLLKR